jgi:hypothetical protein
LRGWSKPAEAVSPSRRERIPSFTIHNAEATPEIATHLSGARKDKKGRDHNDRGDWRKIELSPFFNSILTFRCYTSSRRRKKDRVKSIKGIGSIDKDWERTYNPRRYVREKNGGSGGSDSTQADNNYRI